VKTGDRDHSTFALYRDSDPSPQVSGRARDATCRVAGGGVAAGQLRPAPVWVAVAARSGQEDKTGIAKVGTRDRWVSCIALIEMNEKLKATGQCANGHYMERAMVLAQRGYIFLDSVEDCVGLPDLR